jgi:hypothetical protein
MKKIRGLLMPLMPGRLDTVLLPSAVRLPRCFKKRGPRLCAAALRQACLFREEVSLWLILVLINIDGFLKSPERANFQISHLIISISYEIEI